MLWSARALSDTARLKPALLLLGVIVLLIDGEFIAGYRLTPHRCGAGRPR